MKKLILIILTVFAILTVTNCDLDDGGKGGEQQLGATTTKKFWAQNAVTNDFYQLTAEKLAENTRCVVWAEKGSGVTAATANSIANEYANNIYTKMISNFGWVDNIPFNGQSIPMNTMEFAHAYATGSLSAAKLTILLLDIKDSYKQGVNDSYVAGYFWPYDFLSSVPAGYKTNELDMIYIDTNPGLKTDIKKVYTTLAHEMQHLMNFTSSVQYRVDNETLYTMDTWIDEGLSSAAEKIYSGEHITDRIEWFVKNGNGGTMKGKIDVGNNFYVWGNRVTDSDPYLALDDYATVYLFFQWLRLQSKDSIYKEIIKSTNYDQKAVVNAFNKIKTSGSNYSEWEEMLKDWLKANNVNSASGRDGYANDPTLKNIKALYAPAGTTTLGLYPGEGVYSYSATSPSVSNTGNIKYEYLSGSNTLLTYNSNPNNKNNISENGTTTGQKPPSASVVIAGNLNIMQGPSVISGPFPIGIGDVIRMNKPNKTFNFDGIKIEKVFIDE